MVKVVNQLNALSSHTRKTKPLNKMRKSTVLHSERQIFLIYSLLSKILLILIACLEMFISFQRAMKVKHFSQEDIIIGK